MELIIELLEQTNEAPTPSVACVPLCLGVSLSHNVSFTESGVFEQLELTIGAVRANYWSYSKEAPDVACDPAPNLRLLSPFYIGGWQIEGQ